MNKNIRLKQEVKEAETNGLKILKFDAAKLPVPYESDELSEEKQVYYGYDNRYPEFLLSLYNECPLHASIIKGKANFIIGKGLKFANGNAVYIKVNASDSFNDLISKVVRDYLIFNYFCIEVTYNKFNQPIEYHFVPAHKIRTNRSKTKFWYYEHVIHRGNPIIFDRWKEHTDDSVTKMFFFAGPSSSVYNVYPEPEYNSLVKTLLTDIEIRNFNLNNIQNHFSVSTLITFFRGSNVSDEIKKQVLNDLKASYTGATGKKLIVDFQDPNQPSADVKNISPNDWDKVYDLIGKKVNDDIVSGHQVTSPMLFGIKTEGQLGGGTEIETVMKFSRTLM